MKLPNVEQAIVPQAKITDYLLSRTHSDGRYKAAFFVQFGFYADLWEVLAQTLINHASEYDVVNSVASQYGIRYVIEGPLQIPSGRMPVIRTVWFVDNDSIIPRFVTAYPL